jgi:hypothetical protein
VTIIAPIAGSRSASSIAVRISTPILGVHAFIFSGRFIVTVATRSFFS